MKSALLLSFFLMTSAVWASSRDKKKVVYKSHTQIDFTGDKIEGKVKAPAVFYIFQRKRSVGHLAAEAPARLSFHNAPMKKILKEAIRE
jgi:hypothetical protein